MTIKKALRLLATMGQGVIRGIPPASEDYDPVELFGLWFQAAQESGILIPESACLATATADGIPSARMVLLKKYDQEGFVFYTNYGSRKAAELDSNPRASLVFHWTVLERQVRIEGTATRTSAAESDAYFSTRTRGSRIGAWASRQSAVLAKPGELKQRVRDTERRFADQDVPLPGFWGGYRLAPQVIEFWQGRANRLHDRLQFIRHGEGWRVARLYP